MKSMDRANKEKLGEKQPTERLTCIGDSKAVGRLYVVDVRDQVKGSFRSIGAGVVKEDR